MQQPHVHELVRSMLIFFHLAALIAAGIAIAFGDFAILRHRPVNRDLLLKSSRAVAWSLSALWLTGLSVIALDMGTTDLSLATAPKLQAKLAVVVLLTLNGYLLHRYTLSAFSGRQKITEQDVRLAAVLGAISGVSWAYAVFLGVAKAWAPLLGFSGFITLYAAAVLVGILVSMRWVRPLLLEPAPSRSRPVSVTAPTAADDDLNAVTG